MQDIETAQRIDLSAAPTRELVRELERREGVKATMVEPHKSLTVRQDGPAIVLVVID